jgi:DNA replication protein DnaC
MLRARGIAGVRVLQGLLALTKRHADDDIERTCEVALSYQAVKQGFVVLYRSIFDVVRDFLHEEALGEDDKVLARYLKPDLLVIDDMGMKQLPKRSGEYLFEIIMRRYEARSTMMTSNRPLEKRRSYYVLS